MDEQQSFKEELQEQFINNPESWQKVRDQVNESIQKVDPSFDKKKLYTYDELCKTVLEKAEEIENDKSIATRQEASKAMYKSLIKHKVLNKNVRIFKDTDLSNYNAN